MESDRIRFLTRMMRMFAVAVVLVVVAMIVLVLLFVTTNISREMRDELREHEQKEALARQQLEDFVAEEHDITRDEIARSRKRVAQLEDFIIKKGLEPPRNGFVSGVPLGPPQEQAAKEGPKPGMPGGPPEPAPPHPTPGPGPPGPGPGPPSPGPEPPGPTPSPTVTCIDIPEPIPDFCV